MKNILMATFMFALSFAAGPVRADKLRIISWADYVPADLIAAFKKETGIDVELTLSNNEEMISKLRATGGAGYDLAQPSQDRISAAQREFGIYKPFDLAKLKLEQFQPEFLAIVRKNPTLDGKVYGDPRAYGALMDQVGAALIACKPNFKFFYDNKDQLLNGIRSGEVVAAMMWDTGGWALKRAKPHY